MCVMCLLFRTQPKPIFEHPKEEEPPDAKKQRLL